MKEKMKRLFAATLAGVMSISFAACGTNTDNNGGENGDDGSVPSTYSYLAIDINPSIEFMVNGETVVGVKACNDDASVLLSGENLENMSVEAATEKVVELAEELGYLTEDNDDVKIVVTADSEEVASALEQLAEKGAGKGSLLAKINHIPRIADERQVNKLKEKYGEKFKDLSAGKLRLIEAIMEYDETMTYELGVEMSVSELSEMLDGYVDEMADIVGEEMKELFESKYKEIRRMYESQIATLYGEEYKAAWDRFVALEKVVKDIEKKAQKSMITAEDVKELQEILGWEDETTTEPEQDAAPEQGIAPEQDGAQEPRSEKNKGLGRPEINEDGELHLDDFDKFFDRHEEFFADMEKYEQAFDRVEEILENYDEDEYVLTEEDLAATTEAWGEAIEVTTFEELKAFLEEQEKALEEMRKELENPIIKGILKGIEAEMKGMKEQAKDYMKLQMEAAKADFQSKKDALRNK